MSDTQRIKYKNCFVAYLDILGFKEKVKKTKENPESLENLIEVLKINFIFTQSDTKNISDGKIDIRSFFFSDSFVFMMKVEEKNLPHLFLIIRYLQDRLWENGLCLRGAIVKGSMYWPESVKENIILGPAMLEAYRLESKIAIFPRIAVSQELYKYIESEEIKTWSENGDTPLSDFIKKDKDGVYFFDILNPHITRKKREHIERNKKNFSIRWNANDENNYEQVIVYVNEVITKNMNSENEEVRQKYEWLRSYLEKSQGNR